MKAILIIPGDKIITYAHLPDNTEDLLVAMKRHLRCERLAAIPIIVRKKERSLYYDDDGRGKNRGAFLFGGIDICGRGIILDFDESSGEELSTSLSVKDIRRVIDFISR